MAQKEANTSSVDDIKKEIADDTIIAYDLEDQIIAKKAAIAKLDAEMSELNNQLRAISVKIKANCKKTKES